MREVTLAATQMTCSKDTSENVDQAEKLIRDGLIKLSKANGFISGFL